MIIKILNNNLKYLLNIFILLWYSQVSVAADAYQNLEDLLTSVHSLQAQFTQTVSTDTGRLLQRNEGQVWLKKPGQFRWEIKGVDARIIVCNGKTLWDFDKALEQVTIQTVNTQNIEAPLIVLMGATARLRKDFHVTTVPARKGICLRDSNLCFNIKPKKSTGSFQSIKIGFKNQKISEMILLDQLGQKSVFYFEVVKMNALLSKHWFHFVPPRGVDIFHNE